MQGIGMVAKRKNGYSLIEILLVLALLSSAAFTFLVHIPLQMEERRLDLSAAVLLQDLREVQQTALAENVWYKIKFSVYTGEYKIFRQGEFIRKVNLQNGVRFANRPSDLTFRPTGTPDTGLTVMLTSGDLERNVIVAPVMGRIRME
jgi:prepilin-type N-terminal cleavage/methylation domain-containing protein